MREGGIVGVRPAVERGSGALVHLSAPWSSDNVWVAKQVDLARDQPPTDGRGRREIDWAFGPIRISGYVDTDKWETGLTVSVLGISIGPIHGDLKDRVVINVDFFLAKGNINLYLKNENEFWVHLDISVKFDGSFTGDYRISSF
ncbi:uncharacterized protein BBA_09100 [Beauveria bassiana ARSEF 2860]|uniref:Uncharacterized protein n=1 Tax=Beauveria bassiana (strain ARSEF 2860) TaxID=655819 RepID=J4KLC1_BEAB2|nr:uncharacterized protein BBA_09100 [Beauveria bassiana ARSEF 2860]EJP61944.1 hypothetical protein BBA_09100 [Beauveria bassiana ARSEF 2860]